MTAPAPEKSFTGNYCKDVGAFLKKHLQVVDTCCGAELSLLVICQQCGYCQLDRYVYFIIWIYSAVESRHDSGKSCGWAQVNQSQHWKQETLTKHGKETLWTRICDSLHPWFGDHTPGWTWSWDGLTTPMMTLFPNYELAPLCRTYIDIKYVNTAEYCF